MSRASAYLVSGIVLLGVTLCAGCGAPPKPQPKAERRPPVPFASFSSTDQCAMRLHDLCGSLLEYYASHHNLPKDAESLKRAPGFGEVAELVCPVSEQPYIYNSEGLPAPNPAARIVLYDSAPSHADMRWAISFVRPAGNAPAIAEVISLPESWFQPK